MASRVLSRSLTLASQGRRQMVQPSSIALTRYQTGRTTKNIADSVFFSTRKRAISTSSGPPVESNSDQAVQPSFPENGAEASEVATTEISASLGSPSVIESVSDLIVGAHSMMSMDGHLFGWGVTLFATGMIVRSITIPLVYYSAQQNVRASLVTQEMMRVQNFLRTAPGTLWEKFLSFRRLREVALRSAGTSSIKLFPWYTVVHLPMFLTTTFAIRRLADLTPPGWATGGIPGWCPDLALADPTGILPVVNTAIFLWNVQGPPLKRSTATSADLFAGNGPPKSDSKSAPATTVSIALFSRDSLSTFFQAVGIFAFPYMQQLPVGFFMFWISSGMMTAAQRAAYASESFRRRIGLPAMDELIRARREAGPPVLKAMDLAVKGVRGQLEYVQREVLSQFSARRVDESLRADVNRALERELRRGKIGISLEAVIRMDDDSGRKYLAVIRRGTIE